MARLIQGAELAAFRRAHISVGCNPIRRSKPDPLPVADRFESDPEYLLLQSIYTDLRLYFNFFQQVLKLISKEHVDNRVIKRYDQAITPYQRTLASKDIPLEIKARLTNL